MDGLEILDHTHAIVAGFNSIWRRIVLFCACGLAGQFVGNIYSATKIFGNFLNEGPGAIADIRTIDLAWLPMEWPGTLVSVFRVETMLYLPDV